MSPSEAAGKPNEPEALHAAPGFAETFLVEGKTPAAGTIRKLPALGDTLAHLAGAGLEDFYRGDVGREIAADLEAIGSPVTRGDLETFRARMVEPLSVKLEAASLYDLPAADPGSRGAPHPRHSRAARHPARRDGRAPPRADRGGEARLLDPRPGLHRSRPAAARSGGVPPARGLRARGGDDRHAPGRGLPARTAPRATRSGWARSTATGLRSPTSSRSIGSGARAACCRGPASTGRTAAPRSRSTRAPRTRSSPDASPSTR